MNYWIRCENCGKVNKYPYPSKVKGDKKANLIIENLVKKDGWIFSNNKTFCCEKCKKECVKNYEETGSWLNLPAVYKYQEQLKNSKK